MKKVLFAVLAAFMVSLSFTSCSKSPEGKMFGLMEDAISIMKDTHIKSADDVKAFADKMKPLKESIEKAQVELLEAYKDKDEKELEEIVNKFEEQAKKLGEEAEKEGARLQKEAEEAGLDISEFEDLDLF